MLTIDCAGSPVTIEHIKAILANKDQEICLKAVAFRSVSIEQLGAEIFDASHVAVYNGDGKNFDLEMLKYLVEKLENGGGLLIYNVGKK